LRYALDGDVVVPGEGRYLRAGFHHTDAGAKMIVSARAWLLTATGSRLRSAFWSCRV
jgi:hypothetical protein